MADPLRFDGRVVLVTGEADLIVQRFRALGADVRTGGVGEADQRLDAVVVHAGAPPVAGREAIQTNLLAPLEVAREANAVMQEQPEGGAIVFVVGMGAVHPTPDSPAHGAAE